MLKNISRFNIVIFIFLATIAFTSCLNSYTNSPKDTVKVSKILSQNESLAKSNYSKLLPYEIAVVYNAIFSAFQNNNEAVVRYKFNSGLGQYVTQSFLFSINPPNKSKGAIISRKRGIFNYATNIILVYVEPSKDNSNQTIISIRLISRNDTAEGEVFKRIQDKLPSNVPSKTP